MRAKRLIILVFAVIWLLSPTKSAEAEAAATCTLTSVDHDIERPQWGDLGMENVLAAGGQSTVAAPTPVRLASNGRRVQGGNCQMPSDSFSVTERTDGSGVFVLHASFIGFAYTSGYLYIISCLRL